MDYLTGYPTTKHQNDKLSTVDYVPNDTLLHKLGQLCVPTGEHRQKLIWDTHYNKNEGHFGVIKIIVTLQNYFYRPSLKSDINKYI